MNDLPQDHPESADDPASHATYNLGPAPRLGADRTADNLGFPVGYDAGQALGVIRAAIEDEVEYLRRQRSDYRVSPTGQVYRLHRLRDLPDDAEALRRDVTIGPKGAVDAQSPVPPRFAAGARLPADEERSLEQELEAAGFVPSERARIAELLERMGDVVKPPVVPDASIAPAPGTRYDLYRAAATPPADRERPTAMGSETLPDGAADWSRFDRRDLTWAWLSVGIIVLIVLLGWWTAHHGR